MRDEVIQCGIIAFENKSFSAITHISDTNDLTPKAPPKICSRRHFQILLLFKK